MPEEHGSLIAQGRAADVYAYKDGYVLRRYRTPHDCVYESAVMQHVRAHGYPVPEVIEVAGPDIVMERLDGPTMLDDFARHPWRLFRHAATIAGLLHQLHAIRAPDWLHLRQGGGDELVHLDLHPLNVLLTSRGPVVIDWTNAGRGDGNAEVADLWLVLSCADIPAGRLERTLIGAGRKLFVRALLSHFDRDAVAAKLQVAYENRSRDRNMSETELGRMRKLVERYAR